MPLKPVPRVEKLSYAHGGFFGVVEPLLDLIATGKEPFTSLATHLPSTNSTLPSSQRLALTALQVENSPVVAAFGHILEFICQGEPHPFRDEIEQICLPNLNKTNGGNEKNKTPRPLEWDCHVNVEAFKSGKIDEKELFETLWVAHGSGSTLVLGAITGETYTRCVKNDIGAFAKEWLKIYAKTIVALLKDEAKALYFPSGAINFDEKSQLFEFYTKSWANIFGVSPENYLQIVLDVKTKTATPEILSIIVKGMNSYGVLTNGIGSFTFTPQDLMDISNIVQVVHDKKLPAPSPMRFFHTAGDVVGAFKSGKLTKGEVVYFNAGSLVRKEKDSLVGKPKLMEALASIVAELKIRVGIYFQEHMTHDKAASVILDIVGKNASVFAEGVSWGCVDGFCHHDEKLKELDSGLGLQGLVGKNDNGNMCIIS